MRYKTYEQWKKEGYFVMKGEKSHKRNKKGVAVFSEEQIDCVLDDIDCYDDSGDPMNYYD